MNDVQRPDVDYTNVGFHDPDKLSKAIIKIQVPKNIPTQSLKQAGSCSRELFEYLKQNLIPDFSDFKKYLPIEFAISLVILSAADSTKQHADILNSIALAHNFHYTLLSSAVTGDTKIKSSDLNNAILMYKTSVSEPFLGILISMFDIHDLDEKANHRMETYKGYISRIISK